MLIDFFFEITGSAKDMTPWVTCLLRKPEAPSSDTQKPHNNKKGQGVGTCVCYPVLAVGWKGRDKPCSELEGQSLQPIPEHRFRERTCQCRKQ